VKGLSTTSLIAMSKCTIIPSIFKTIPAGESQAVIYGNGEVEVIQGPQRVFACGRIFRPLELVVANETEYLEVKFKDGRSEVRTGPTSAVCHPIDHISVKCHAGVQLADNELIVVYRKSEVTESSSVKRELVRGPGFYVPSSVSEWIHEFSWTGPASESTDINAPARKTANALKKKKLLLIPGKMYYDVENVRTKDNALITVKTMIFYQLRDVEGMLDNTNDPMADIINSLSADIIEWCAPKQFSEFLAETDSLNTLKPYVQLQMTAAKIGYNIDKVVFRGYSAPASLQRMHDGAIEKRTQLALAKESEQEEQELADLKLQREAARSAQQHALELQTLEHELLVKEKKEAAEQNRQKTEHLIEFERLKLIRSLDREGETAMAHYLAARDCQLAPVVQCATMMSGTSAGLDSLAGRLG